MTRLAFAPKKNKMVHKGANDVQLDLAKMTSSLLEADDQPWFPECALAPMCKGHGAEERGGECQPPPHPIRHDPPTEVGPCVSPCFSLEKN